MNQKSEDYLREWFRAGPLPDEATRRKMAAYFNSL